MTNRLVSHIIDFAMPQVCLNCESKIYNFDGLICSDCGFLLKKLENNFTDNGQISMINLYPFENDKPIQKILHSLKYEKMKTIGRKLGRELGKEIQLKVKERFDMIAPVPLHITKERERTYNQSEYICKGIGDVLKIRVENKLVRRVRYTESQARLDRDARQSNVRGAFEVNPKFKDKIMGKNIILVDDVITTGATIMECASALIKGGCGKVLASSIAIA